MRLNWKTIWKRLDLFYRRPEQGEPRLPFPNDGPKFSFDIVDLILASACCAGLLELLELTWLPQGKIWFSHFLTILSAVIIAAIFSFWILLNQKNLKTKIEATEERYRLLFGRSLAGAYRITLDGRIEDCNVSFCKMLGYSTRRELIGTSLGDVYTCEQDHIEFVNRLCEDGSLTNFEQRLRRADGSILFVLNSAVFTQEEKTAPSITGTLTDITDIREAEQEQRRLAAIVQCSDDGVMSLSLDGTIQTWNDGAKRIFGYEPNEVLGKSISILAPPDRREEYRDLLTRVKDGSQEHIEFTRVRKDGRQIEIAVSTSPITDVSNRIIGLAAVVRDITEQKQSEKTLRSSEAQYRLMFERNPIPMWLFDRGTLRFLAVNAAAIKQYGYSEEEFLQMTIKDIRPKDEINRLLQHTQRREKGLQTLTSWRHLKKDGSLIDVEIVCHDLSFQGVDAMFVVAYDVTKRNVAPHVAQDVASKFSKKFEDSFITVSSS